MNRHQAGNARAASHPRRVRATERLAWLATLCVLGTMLLVRPDAASGQSSGAGVLALVPVLLALFYALIRIREAGGRL